MKKSEPFSLAKRARSFGYAFEGWKYVLQHEHNARIHLFISMCVLIVGLWLEIGRIEWAILILTFIPVWAGEIFNTAIEAIVNMTSPDPHPLAKVAKDTAAGAVLFAACAAVVIGLLILGPPLWQKISMLLG